MTSLVQGDKEMAGQTGSLTFKRVDPKPYAEAQYDGGDYSIERGRRGTWLARKWTLWFVDVAGETSPGTFGWRALGTYATLSAAKVAANPDFSWFVAGEGV
ncbi:hypothetical protein [Mycolicibacterium austroafricanum]|uniref:hypothetical protein n=1 Tax=Mycolicibacterium austroafricanum TaxID=39687 RepID=UPI0011AEBE41|nr:hypothetical protein [Mycolicibacterium austroafricanum]QZY44370.1 hypothetical protein K5L12_19055 [Mycolicibacterium austroafricanum]